MQAALDKLQFFLQTFPNIKALATASESQVLQAFSGLGYYNRARNLHKAAKYILQNYGEKNFPATWKELKAVAGIGDYTTAAILSISFNLPVLAIDANVMRIFQRMALQNLSSPLNKIETKKIRLFFEPFFSPVEANKRHHNGDTNEALMQLGQKICTAKNPVCNVCPLASCCQLFLQNADWEKFPQKKKPPTKVLTQWNLFILCANSDIQTNDNFVGEKTNEMHKPNEPNESNKAGNETLESNQKILIKKLNDFYFLRDHYGFAGCITFLETNSKKPLRTSKQTDDPLACLLKNFLEKNFHGNFSANNSLATNSLANDFSLENNMFQKEEQKNSFLKTLNAPSKITKINFRHTITHHNIDVRVYNINLETVEKKTQTQIRKIIQEDETYKWVNRHEAKKYLSASVFLKALEKSARGGT